VQEYKKDLQSQMVHIKQEEEQKRKKLQEQIAQQKEQIRLKEAMIADKRKKLEMVRIIRVVIRAGVDGE
jgi:hypothetical protein